MNLRPAWLMLFVLNAFVALTSIVCGVGLAAGVIPFPLAWLHRTPFGDYTSFGLVMALLVGGSALVAAATSHAGRRAGFLFSAVAGLLLAGFEVVDVALIDPNLEHWLLFAVPLQAACSLLALAIVGLTTFLWRDTYRGKLARTPAR